MTIYNKLVRDNTIGIFENESRACTYSILTEEEYHREWNAKLQEKVRQFLETNSTEELADVLELVLSLGKKRGVSEEDLMVCRNQKREARGGFDRGLFLQELTETE